VWHKGHYSLIDVNRSGIPLMEIVSEPEISSPEEARDYLVRLRAILRYLGVSTGHMEEGSFRCDANISIRPAGSKELSAKVEVKNMNSFKAVYQALEYESTRQRTLLRQGGEPVQETRGWIAEEAVTVSQRAKEYADDYRYFPEPDLPPLAFDSKSTEQVRARLPELPETRRDRLSAQYSLPLYDSSILTNSKEMADYFEKCIGLTGPHRAKVLSNWLLGDFSRLLNSTNTSIQDSKISPESLLELLDLTDRGAISGPAAKMVFQEMFSTGKRASHVVAERDLEQLGDITELTTIVKQVLSQNAKAVSDYRAGKEQSLTFLTGQVMKATRGRANPSLAKDVLMQELGKTD